MRSKNKQFKDFKEARAFVVGLGLKSRKEWLEYCKSGNKPKDIPAQPQQVYKDKGWISMGNLLGTKIIGTRNKKFRSFEDARRFVRSLGLKSLKEWKTYCQSGDKPTDIPSAPDISYQDKGWEGFGDWLGTGSVSNLQKKFRSFEDARIFVRSLGLKSGKEWKAYCKSGDKPTDIPSNPSKSYQKKGWVSSRDWFGKKLLKKDLK